jgi:hypothetical protein
MFLFILAAVILAMALLIGCGDVQTKPVDINVKVSGGVEIKMERDRLRDVNKKLKEQLKSCKKKKCTLWGRQVGCEKIQSLF